MRKSRSAGSPISPETSGDAHREAKLRRVIASLWRHFGWGNKREAREELWGFYRGGNLEEG
jgi:hypothetical protein